MGFAISSPEFVIARVSWPPHANLSVHREAWDVRAGADPMPALLPTIGSVRWTID